METDTKGDIVYIALTDINGNTILRDERNDSTLQNKLYTGHKYDNVTQLTYAHARYLDTRTHTFTSVDPLYYRLPTSYLTDPQQLNAYSYAGNNPVSNTDPTGLAKATGAIATFNQMMVNAPAGTHSSAASQKAFNSQVNATMNIIYGTSGGGGSSNSVSASGSSSKGTGFTIGNSPTLVATSGAVAALYNGYAGLTNYALDSIQMAYAINSDPDKPYDPYQLPYITPDTIGARPEYRQYFYNTEMTTAGATIVVGAASVLKGGLKQLSKNSTQTELHGNDLNSLKPTWGYKLYSDSGEFLKNGITSKIDPLKRYTQKFMSDKTMVAELFNTRRDAYAWEYLQNLLGKGPLNKNMH